jgi:DNA (cytosine-5)-methyltransferase 1
VTVRVGSLCTGVGGLELGLRLAGVDVETVFVSDIDVAASEWLDARMPGVPNLGDFTALDRFPEDVDVLTAGFPCQPVSYAGERKGVDDDRWIWPHIVRLAGASDRLPVLFVENVPGLLTANGGSAFGEVVHSLAEVGYCMSYGTLAAGAVGAPHRRIRWFGLAYHADSMAGSPPQPFGLDKTSLLRPRDRAGTGARYSADSAANTEGAERRTPQQQGVGASVGSASESGELDSPNAARFGKYAAAVDRWEHVLGRSAPDPADDGRLSAAFVEWMMGFPAGWVCDVQPSRNKALRMLGNAVVPQCASEAFVQLSDRFDTEGAQR